MQTIKLILLPDVPKMNTFSLLKQNSCSNIEFRSILSQWAHCMPLEYVLGAARESDSKTRVLYF